jgi:hypothetical protein
MSKKEGDIVKYLAIGGAVAATYAVVNYLSNRSARPKPLSL